MTGLGIVLLAAGQGLRMNDMGHNDHHTQQTRNQPAQETPKPKQYCLLAGKPVLTHAFESLLSHPKVTFIQPVIGQGQQRLFQACCPDDKRILPFVYGGASRQASVRQGLLAMEAKAPDFVLIHDSARPFIPLDMLSRLIDALEEGATAVAPALPVTDSLRHEAGGYLGKSQPRETLRAMQTPQGGRFSTLLSAHNKVANLTYNFTDDAELMRHQNYAVRLVRGDERARKLTTKGDRVLMEIWAQSFRKHERLTGQGFDVHAFGSGDQIRLGGVTIPHNRGLVGHSDADVLLHALTDALLGALGDGDIGTHFPPSDMTWKNADSEIFLRKALDLLAKRQGRLVHIDVTIIGESPKIKDHRPAILARLSALTGLPSARLGLKATTTERLGFAGREEGLAALALATIEVPAEDEAFALESYLTSSNLSDSSRNE